MTDSPHTGWPGHLLQDQCRALFDWMASNPCALRLVRESVKAIEGEKMSVKPVAWLMTYSGCDGSADWVEIGADEPEPEDGAEAHALVRMSEVDDAKTAEFARWKSALDPVMPEDFKDWHQNAAAELPEIAAWVIRNLRERVAEIESALDAKDAEIERLRQEVAKWQAEYVRADVDWQDATTEIDHLREALRRLREWGGIAGKNYSATVAFDVAAWIDAGCKGPLPEAPEYARVKPDSASAKERR